MQYLFYFLCLCSVWAQSHSHMCVHSFCYAPKVIWKLVNVSGNFLFLHLLADSQWMVLCTTNFESANFGRELNCKYTLAEIRICDLQPVLQIFLLKMFTWFLCFLALQVSANWPIWQISHLISSLIHIFPFANVW